MRKKPMNIQEDAVQLFLRIKSKSDKQLEDALEQCYRAMESGSVWWFNKQYAELLSTAIDGELKARKSNVTETN